MSTSMKTSSTATDEEPPAVASAHDRSQLDTVSSDSESETESLDGEDTSDYPADMPYCTCRGPCKEGDPEGEMLACRNPKCLIEWYHKNCVGLEELPGKGVKWECQGCKHPKFVTPTPNKERLHWYGENYYAESHSMDERLEGERSRVLGLKERTEMEAASAGEFLRRWKKAKAAEEKKAKAAEGKKAKVLEVSKKSQIVRKDSPLDGKDNAMVEIEDEAKKTAPVNRVVQKKDIAQRVKKGGAATPVPGIKRKAVSAAASAEDDDRQAKRGKGGKKNN